MSRNPTILIGLGGAGTTIVTKVRRRLLASLADRPALQQSLVDRRFQFLAFDTWVDSGSADDLLRRGQLRATGNTPLNAIVQQKKDSKNDPFFSIWWPYKTLPFPGDISDGAGQGANCRQSRSLSRHHRRGSAYSGPHVVRADGP